jgi:F0F1-type ATP synthase membrane subunit a
MSASTRLSLPKTPAAARAPARFTAVVMMGVSVLFALAVWQVLAKRQARQRGMAGAVCDCALEVVNTSPTQAATKEWRLIFILVFSLPSLSTVRGNGGD